MKLNIELDDELKPAIELHLATDGQVSVQSYIRCALIYFAEMYQLEKEGRTVGYSRIDASESFNRYNNEKSPKDALASYCGVKIG